jgi:serine/threonine protein kinase
MVSASRESPTVLIKLAEGGMAEVFVAMREDQSLVVIKRIPSARQVSPALVECLREEARLAARLDHPNVCRLLATTEDDRGHVTLEMEYLEGVQLRRLASSSSDLSLIAGLLVQAAAGLDHVHDATEPDGRPAGIVHRDVNPQNLMVTASGEVKLLDFGIAKARDTELRTRTGSVKGTPAYLSPEQVRGEPVDRRADVFALGSTAVKLLVGEAPFARENFFATVQAITGAPLPDLRAQRPDLPPAIIDVLARALERDRELRYETAGAFASAFVAALPANVRPLEPIAIAERIGAQFGLELADRRRRIEFAIEQLDSDNVPLEPASQRAQTSPTQLLDAEGTTTLASPTSSRGRPRRTRWITLAALLGVAAAAAVVLGVNAMRAEDHPAKPLLAVAPPLDAAAATEIPPTKPTPTEPTPPAPPPPVPPPRRSPTHRQEPPRKSHTATTAEAAKDAPGFLTVGSTPYSTIHVDGVKLGVTPLFRKPVAAGRRRLRAECSCGKTRELWVTIEPGVAAPAVKLTW